jgi:hypothetical protein
MFFAIRFVELKIAVICYRSDFETDKFSMSWSRWKLGCGPSALAVSGGKTNFGWAAPILAEHRSFCRSVGKNMLVPRKLEANRTRAWMYQYRNLVHWARNAARLCRKLWLYLCKVMILEIQKSYRHSHRINESFPPKTKVSYNKFWDFAWRHCRV